MKNGLLYGSFNPLHNSHVDLIKKGLEYFDTLYIFVRSEGERDIADYTVKRSWLETLSAQLDRRLRIYPLEFPEGSIKPDGGFDLIRIFSHTEEQAGVRIDGMICGGDKDIWLNTLKPAFPDREFIVIPRSDIRSHKIRDDVEGLKDLVPDYVYASLSGKQTDI